MVDDGIGRDDGEDDGEDDAEDGEDDAEDGEDDAEDERDRDVEGFEDLEEENDELRERVAELELELASLRKASASSRLWSWILGTFGGAVALVLVVIFLGRGFPGSGGAVEVPGEDPVSADQEEALNALVSEHAEELQACLEALVAGSEAPDGTIIVTSIEVTAAEGGLVTRARITGDEVPESFATCLRSAVSSWTFPASGDYVLQAPFEVRRSAAGAAEGSPAGAGEEGRRPAGEVTKSE
jgi:hypothetical protein